VVRDFVFNKCCYSLARKTGTMISRDADSILFVFVFMVMFKLRKVGHYGACGWRHLLLDTRCPIKENKKHSYTVSTRVFGNVRTHYSLHHFGIFEKCCIIKH